MKHVHAQLSSLTLEEKASLTTGKNFWYLQGVQRLNIPEIMVTDGPHGLRKQSGDVDHVGLSASKKATCFPTASLLASTWDKELVRSVGVALGEECKQEKVSVLLGPGANIKRHPLCGRNFEYFSEDPLLSGEMASAWIEGVQSEGIGTSLKHYVANNQETMRMVVDTIVDERTLRELYLKSFEIAVKQAHPWTVMCSYNKVNGTYLSEHNILLQQVLRKEWGYDGVLITDWGANNNRIKGLQASMDLEMPSSGPYNPNQIIKAIRNGELDETTLDESVNRLLHLIDASKPALQDSFTYSMNDHHNLARRVAAEGTVLLQNKNTLLPLTKDTKVALIGAFATKPRYQGAGSSIINPHKISTAYDAMKEMLQDDFLYCDGYSLENDDVNPSLIEEAITISKQADVVIVMVGLPSSYESEGFDRDHLNLPPSHNELITELSKHHSNIVVALSNGAPVKMPWKENVSAILESYLGGQASGEALVDVLYGTINPSGRLAETFPNSVEEFPANDNFPGSPRQVQYKEGLYVGYRAYDSMNVRPLFPFGYGLSYSTFTYQDFKIELVNDIISISLSISNTSDIDGKEIIQVYTHKPTSLVYRPNQELKGYTKVDITANTTNNVHIQIPLSSLEVYNNDRFKLEAGEYEVRIAISSRDILFKQSITISSNDVLIPDRLKLYHHPTSTFTPNTEDFEALLGHKVPDIDPVKPYNLTSTFGEIKHTFIGKQLYKMIQKEMSTMMSDTEDETTKRMLQRMIDELPFKGLIMLSDGKLSHNRGEGIIDFLNHKYLKGIWKIIRG